ncbi:MAG: dTMP kinase [Actinomycetota bacterium]|nr:dTMP kinase [Actinomycetota bacterium]
MAVPVDVGHQLRAVLRVPAFRRLFIVLSLSSVGDWLGLLATTTIAAEQVSGTAAKGAAFGGVVVVRLLPALLLAPLAGAVADRFDRRITMIVCDVLRFLLFATIPIVGRISWTLIASFLIEVVAMFWIPAKEASVPNLVRKDQLETANQVSLFSTYGLTPVVASLVFASLSTVTRLLAEKVPDGYFATNRVDLALYFNALTFLVSAIVVVFIPQISGRRADGTRPKPQAGLWRSIVEGWRYVRQSKLVRGLVIGIFGALSAGGFVVGIAKFYAESLGGGDATFGLLFACLFIGLGAGMGFGPKLARDLSRRRWFAMSIVLAGTSVMALFAVPFLALAMVFALLVGLGAGMAYLAGLTLLGREVDDELRGRVFAFIQSMVRVVLMLATAVSSLLVGLGGQHTVHLGSVPFTFNASRGLLLVGGAMAVTVGVIAFRQMDDKRGVAVLPDLIASLRRRPLHSVHAGLFIALEGGEGTGKSTQAALLRQWLQEGEYDCVVTHEPGGTGLGEQIRALLLDPASAAMSPRAEALLYAADRANHVDTVIRPALQRGAVVVTDRYVDSSLAYQGAGRALPVADVLEVSSWATRGLRPDLVIVLDLDPAIGLRRAGRRGPADRLEAEALDFHERVRQAFLSLAGHGGRYLVVDASDPPEVIAAKVRERVKPLLVRPFPPVAAPVADPATPAGRDAARVSE